MTEQSQVFLSPDDDPAMAAASQNARDTFRYFWRELTWEYRRIIGALGAAVVKVAFADPPGSGAPAAPPEHMWLNEVQFDGATVTATLMNSPNWVQSVQQGQRVQVPFQQVGDWMYSRGDRAYGAYTVNLMRSRMGAPERAQHDAAWGFDFGDPANVALIPNWDAESAPPAKRRGFGRKQAAPAPPAAPADLQAEHPMALNMAIKINEQLQQDAEGVISYRDERGFGPLHDMALGGSAACVQVLLNHGADPRAVTGHGWSPAQLAYVLGWNDVVALLQQHGG